jgi:hypothetical protein
MALGVLSTSVRLLTGNVNTVSFNCNPPSQASVMYLCCSWQSDVGGTTITGMTYHAVSMTKLVTIATAGGGIDIYYINNPDFLGGSTPAVVNWSATTNIGATIGAMFFTGSRANPNGTLVNSSGNSTTPSVTVTPKAASSIPVGVLFLQQGATSDFNITAGSGEIAQWLNPTGDTGLGTRTGGAGEYQNKGGDGVMDFTIDAPGCPWAMVGFEVLAAIPGGANLMMLGVG